MTISFRDAAAFAINTTGSIEEKTNAFREATAVRTAENACVEVAAVVVAAVIVDIVVVVVVPTTDVAAAAAAAAVTSTGSDPADTRSRRLRRPTTTLSAVRPTTRSPLPLVPLAPPLGRGPTRLSNPKSEGAPRPPVIGDGDALDENKATPGIRIPSMVYDEARVVFVVDRSCT
jgi:hypothetical protein